ncbi:unnamed protein product [Didymodactylos carnosus]|uniref:Ubiquitin-like domain-containing protein n=1 Tax=Didymodactylos carnosus TaxID=1234261 RepID=A0A815B5X3_9BILA|nr:unnamed protein product [Didymodactylos carnosus]CAF1266041.1 unnamed protein product [Didymodactylos carnosus]CAF3836989.1 unnamed protein product [Didymodactylos carnosus]CAF4049072.1 unnamed protein product [Didymodactylos carnosus]
MAATAVIGRSFSDALYERYCDFESSWDDLKSGCDIVFFVGTSPKKTESGIVLTSSSVVLTDEKISHVGDPRAVQHTCCHVELVDISSNELSDWDEISLLLNSLPHVKMINMSFNPFPTSFHVLPDDIRWPNLNTLCLNGSRILFEMIIELLKKTPNLEELQLCANGYKSIEPPLTDFKHSKLKRIYISNNELEQWMDLCQLGLLFPQLETVIASENPLQTFRLNNYHGQMLLNVIDYFPKLTTLSVNQVQIKQWDDIIELNQISNLNTLRIHSAPLFKSYKREERFFLVIGYMPKLSKFNGSYITANERETNERRFIRYYAEKDDKPQRYYDLINKHGPLKPLVDIKILTPHLTTVHLVYNQYSIEKEIDLRQTVQQFKKLLETEFHVPVARMRLFYIDEVAFSMGACGPEELKYPQRLLHTYNVHDQDKFYIDLKNDKTTIIKKHSVSKTKESSVRRKMLDSTSAQQSDEINYQPNSSISISSHDDKQSDNQEENPFSFNYIQTFNNNKQQQIQEQLMKLDDIDHLLPSLTTNMTTTTAYDDDLLAAVCARVLTTMTTSSK